MIAVSSGFGGKVFGGVCGEIETRGVRGGSIVPLTRTVRRSFAGESESLKLSDVKCLFILHGAE